MRRIVLTGIIEITLIKGPQLLVHARKYYLFYYYTSIYYSTSIHFILQFAFSIF